MIDQSFSAENFEKIFNIENRKGNINKDTLPADYISLVLRIKEIRTTIKELKAKYESGEISKDEYLESRDTHSQTIKDIQLQKETVLYEHMKKISEEVNSSKFKFDFKIGDRNGKPTYEIGNSIAQFYAIKQLQYNIRKTFKVKQSDRYRILKQIKLLLSDGFPKIVIRTDIKSFYESIPQDKLVDKVLESTLLTHKSKQFITNIIQEYERLKDKIAEPEGYGIPRGVGISAYLSELYMNDVDKSIRAIENVTFYSRYVDDIFIVITPTSKNDSTNYLKIVEDILTKYGLTMKQAKTKVENFLRSTTHKSTIEYLGYSFEIDYGNDHCHLKINLTQSKIDKYKERLQKAFDDYNAESKYNERRGRRLLFNRLCFLSGNTKLLNSKEGIKVGVYYSNSLLEESNLKSLTAVNGFLKRMVYTNLKPYCSGSFDVGKLKTQIIRRFDFCEGFKQKRFHNYTTNELIEIKKIW
jgi:hypothetical protein